MRLAASTTVLLVTVLSWPAFGQESSQKDFQDYCKALQGRWVGDVTWVADFPGLGQKGEKVTAYWEGRMSEDGSVLVGKFFGGNGSESSMTYFDAVEKKIKATAVDSGGTVTQILIYRKDGKWTQKGQASFRDGTVSKFTSVATISEDGKTWTWEGTGTVGDKPTADQHDVWRRVNK
ncbi:MAG: hypothetical protein ACYC6Y_12915 [Thermoguttaceae bacterium]